MNSEQFLSSLVDDIQNREQEKGFAALPIRDQTFSLVWALEAEVNNGGFNQFFYNSAGDRTLETLVALRRINAEHTAALLEEAIFVFGPAGVDRIWVNRQEQVIALTEVENERLDELDKTFYAYTDNLSELLVHFMKATL